MPLAAWPSVVAGCVVLVAAAIDAVRHRIPNLVVVAGVVAAFGVHAWAGGAGALVTALAGLAVGLAVMLPFYAIGAMGAGDAKLMAAVGAALGPRGVLSAAILTFVVGAVLALAIALASGRLASVLANVREILLRGFFVAVTERRAEVAQPTRSAGRLPYGIAIAAGTLLQIALDYRGMRIV